jgi:hypothetical protein
MLERNPTLPSANTMAEVWGAPPHTLLLRHVHMLQILGAQLQSLCEKRSFVAQLKTDLQKPQTLMTAENLLAPILYMLFYCICLPNLGRLSLLKGKAG